LIERDFVARLVDTCEGEEAGLFDLPVDDGVRGEDVGVAGVAVAWGVYFGGDGFVAEPVAAGDVRLSN
jgi:hypothetical protein